ncbi:MAG: phage tail protein [Terrabacter sp.]|nr:phage tail protein [Terrabacter sp.]
MSYAVDFTEVSTTGLESSPVAEALAGLRANEARYFKNKYDHVFVTEPADASADLIAWVHGILEDERGIAIASPPLEATLCDVDGISWAHVFYESGLAVNVLWTRAEGGKRAVGFKLSEGMEPPDELAAFKWVRQKSKLAGTIRGTYFVIKGSHDLP